MDLCFATCTLNSADETQQLAHKISPLLEAGDVVLLEGPLGAGKSHFARGIIQAQLGLDEEVPSPTFTLVQIYETPKLDFWHCDLYRLESPEAALELGLDEAFESSVCLVEWPSRLGEMTPPRAVTIQIETGDGDTCRNMRFVGRPSALRSRLETILNG